MTAYSTCKSVLTSIINSNYSACFIRRLFDCQGQRQGRDWYLRPTPEVYLSRLMQRLGFGCQGKVVGIWVTANNLIIKLLKWQTEVKWQNERLKFDENKNKNCNAEIITLSIKRMRCLTNQYFFDPDQDFAVQCKGQNLQN